MLSASFIGTNFEQHEQDVFVEEKNHFFKHLFINNIIEKKCHILVVNLCVSYYILIRNCNKKIKEVIISRY